MKVRGPYTHKTGGLKGRKFVVIDHGDRKTTMLYSRYLYQIEHNVTLDIDETVDHIDRDFTNDSLDNLRMVPRSQHIKEDTKRVKPIEVICIWCGASAFQKAGELRRAAKKDIAGPFCGKSCAGKYGAEVQNGRQKILGRVEMNLQSEYFYLKK